MDNIGKHATGCRIGPGCVDCWQDGQPPAFAVRAEAYHLGRHREQYGGVSGRAIREVSAWLRADAHEADWVRSEGQRQCLALWLIALRDRLEARRWGLG